MEELKIVAILDKSGGENGVGTVWQETKVFEANITLKEVIDWAQNETYGCSKRQLNKFRDNLRLTIAQ